MLPPKTFALLQHKIYETLGKESDELFYLLGYLSGKNASIVLMKRYGFNKKDLDKFVDGATQDGFGYVKIIQYPEENKTVKAVLKSTGSDMARFFQNQKYGRMADSFLTGMIAGGSEPLFDVPIRCYEEKCIGKGDEYCIFHLEETKKSSVFNILKKTGISLDDLNSKILKLYMTRKNKLNFFERKEVNFGDGTFKLRGIQGVLLIKSVMVILNQVSLKLLKGYESLLNDVSNSLLEDISNNPRLPLKVNIDDAFRKMEVYGMGKFELKQLSNKLILIENKNNMGPEEHKSLFGVSKTPICIFEKILLENILSKLLDKSIKVSEINCISQGKEKCIFKAII